jgi:hypothetical protein
MFHSRQTVVEFHSRWILSRQMMMEKEWR